MSSDQITKEQAQVILEDYLVQKAKEKARTLKIEDKQPEGVAIYGDSEDCFFVYVPDDNHFFVGASRLIGISKKTGKITIDGMYGE